MNLIRLDTTGLNCPLPFLKLRKLLRALPPGAQVEVLSTDPLAPDDFRELCQAQGHQLTASQTDNGITRSFIDVCATADSNLPATEMSLPLAK